MSSRHDEEIQAMLAADSGIVDALGLEFLTSEDGSCTFACQVDDKWVNAGGFAHGGLLFSIADTACAYAVRSTGVRGVTISANMNYLRGARGGMRLETRASVVNATRRLAHLTATVEAVDSAEEDRALLATGQFTFMLSQNDST